MSALRVTVTGATGLIGPALVAALLEREHEVTVLSRDPRRPVRGSGRRCSVRASAGVGPDQRTGAGRRARGTRRGACTSPARTSPSAGRAKAKQAIRESRVLGTRNLVAGLRECGRSAAGKRPRTLVSSSAIGYYGAHGEEPLDEDAPPGSDFLAAVCVGLGARGPAGVAARDARRAGAHGRGARPQRRRAGEDAAAVPARRRRAASRAGASTCRGSTATISSG